MKIYLIKKKHFIGATLMVTSWVFPAQSQEIKPAKTPLHSLELGTGLNTIVPYASLRYNQRIAPHWVASGAFQLGPAFTKTSTLAPNPVGTLGLKYYFLETGTFQPFLQADFGGGWSPDRVTPTSQGEIGFFGLVGTGVDILFSPHWGLSVALRSNLNLLNASFMSGTLTLRPEIASVWRF